MNTEELIKFMANRKPSYNAEHFDVSALACYGCAHSRAGDPPPSGPSGERPCCSCIRNPERSEWKQQAAQRSAIEVVVDDRGNARSFDPFAGTQYNGVPFVNYPNDRYVTIDQRAQEDWLDRHPEYKGSVTTGRDGSVKVVHDE